MAGGPSRAPKGNTFRRVRLSQQNARALVRALATAGPQPVATGVDPKNASISESTVRLPVSFVTWSGSCLRSACSGRKMAYARYEQVGEIDPSTHRERLALHTYGQLHHEHHAQRGF